MAYSVVMDACRDCGAEIEVLRRLRCWPCYEKYMKWVYESCDVVAKSAAEKTGPICEADLHARIEDGRANRIEDERAEYARR